MLPDPSFPTDSNRILRRLLSQPGALLYNAALVLAAPVLLAKKWKRSRRARHGYELDMARWTIAARDFELTGEFANELANTVLGAAAGAKSSRHLIFVGIGRSEMLLAERIEQALRRDHPDWRFTWAVRDRASIEEMRREWPAQAMVVLPFDFALPVARWLARLRPDALIFCEKFWFANLAHGARAGGTAVALINARPPDPGVAMSRFGASFNRWILSAFELICAPSEKEQGNWSALLTPETRFVVTGSNRFDLTRPAEKSATLTHWLQSPLPVLAAGSTWEVDEEFVLDAFARVREAIPCVLLIAPRRFERGAMIAQTARERGFSVSLRSAPTPGAEVLVLDTMGELLTAYQFAAGAFIGSTLKGKGHNVAEPLLWGIPVAYGPAPGHFEAEQRECEAAGVGFRVGNADELATHWKRVLSDAQWRRELSLRAARLFEEQGGAARRAAQALEGLRFRAAPNETN